MLKENINHGVCAWCFRDYTLTKELCVRSKEKSVSKELTWIGPDNWEILKKTMEISLLHVQMVLRSVRWMGLEKPNFMIS